jgi:meso-butanediol dehydrogenase / (S,S)-butanediol dehydrogenase / diacetyl reductase
VRPGLCSGGCVMGRFEGRVALITGGGTGIGAAIAGQVVAEGGSVVVTGRREGPVREVADRLGVRALAVTGDAADRGDAERITATTVERFGRLDVLVANAGGHRPGAALDTDDEDWRFAVHTNLDSAFVTVRASLPQLIAARGSIVIVSSIAGLFAGPEVVGYVTTKHALVGLTRSVARDYGRQGVRVNALCPGWVRTPMADEQMDELGARLGIDREEAYGLVTRDTPLGRPAEPGEIASIAAFLASDDASIMTGTVTVADAGAGCVDLPTIAFAP